MSSTKPSFSKALFSGLILEDLVFPFPKMDKEEKENMALIRESFEKFAADKIDSHKIDEDAEIPQEVIDGLKELGFFGLNTSEMFDGFGLSATGWTKALEFVCHADPSVSLLLGAHQSIGIKALHLFGSEEQKKKYLPRLVTGEMIGAFCLTEPGAGSDAAGIKTKAVRDEENGYYVLNGSKLWITNGSLADFFTVFAKEEMISDSGDPHEKITAFIVTRDMGGVSNGQPENKMGIKGSATAAVFFDDVKVPLDHVIGERGRGFKVAMEVLNSGRLGLAGGAVGGLKFIFKHALEHIAQRKQFRKHLNEFEAIKQKVAQITIDLYAAESMVYLTTALYDRGDVDYSLESAMCKIVATEVAWRGANECMQMAGGIGYMKEYPYERIVRDSRINLIFEGTNEILRLFIALAGVQERGEYLKKIGKALRDPIKGFGLLTDFASDWVKDKITTERIREVHPSLTKAKTDFENWAKNLRFTSERVLMEHGRDIIYREMITMRLANAATDLFAMIATISRVDTRINDVGAEKAAEEIKICNLFCEQAWRRVRRNLLMVDKNDDQQMKEVAEFISEKKVYPFETE